MVPYGQSTSLNEHSYSQWRAAQSATLGRISRHFRILFLNPPSGIFGFYFKGSAF
jgi:hypothetical protein